MANNESSCTSMGCSMLFLFGILYYLFTSFPILMTVVTVVIIASCVVVFIMNKENKKKEEERKNYSLNVYRTYPLFFKAYYYQHVSKKPLKEEDITSNLPHLNSVFNLVSDSQARKWNENIIELQKLDKADHEYFLSLIRGLDVLSGKKLKRLNESVVFALPYEATEKLMTKSVSQWLAEKKEKEQFEEYKRKYDQFLPSFLSAHPELKTRKEILSSETLLLDYINKHKQKLAYLRWKRSQLTLNETAESSAQTLLNGNHYIPRQIPIKGIGDTEEVVDDDILISQIAMVEYSDVATKEQSKADLDNHEWVKNLSLCKANYKKDLLKAVVDFIKACSNGKKKESLVVIVKENFLGWDDETVLYHYQQFTSMLYGIDYCEVFDFRNKVKTAKYKTAFIVDLISDEDQVYNISELLLSPYDEILPNLIYISLARELTDEEIKERIEIERQRKQKLLRYDIIADQMENGLSVWSALHPESDRESIVNSEDEIQKIELSVAKDNYETYCSYFKALGMQAGCYTEKLIDTEEETGTGLTPITETSIQSMNLWSEDMALGVNMGKETTFRSICICGLSSTIKAEIKKREENLFSFSPNLDNLLRSMLSILNLPLNYPWIIIEGNGNNLYIIIKSGDKNDKSIETSIGLVNAKFVEQRKSLFLKEEEKAPFDSLIVRWNSIQTMPPSFPQDKEKCYKFLSAGIPSTEPAKVSTTSIDELMYSFCSKIEYKSFVYNGRLLYLACLRKIKTLNVNSFESTVTFTDAKSWIESSVSTGANIEKGINYALGLNGYVQSSTKALQCLKAANTDVASYNIASLIAAGVIPGSRTSVRLYLSSVKGKMSHVNVINNNAKYTFKQDSWQSNKNKWQF